MDAAGLVAQTVMIEHQVINVTGHPQWIQTLELDQLKIARDRLYRASRRHESYAVLPIMVPAVVVMVIVWLATLFSPHLHQVWTEGERYTVLLVAVLLAIPCWLSLYDIRRRHRLAVAAAEKRWAEIEVEIALRGEVLPPLRARLRRFFRR